MTDQNPVPVAPEPAVPPAPVPPAPSAPTGKKSPLPLLAIILAGIALVLAVIPAVAGLAWLPAIAAIVLAIIALVKKAQPRLLTILALVIAPIAWAIAVVVVVVSVASGLGDAIDSAQPGASDEQAEEQPEEQPEEAAAGTRDNPLPIGSTITQDDWTVVINSVTLGATDAVLAANQFNQSPPEGSEYVLINYTVTYTGDDPDGESAVFVGIEYVTPQGNTVDATDTLVVAPDELDRLSPLYSGASLTGNTALAIPSADADKGVLAVRPGILGDKVFVSVT